MTKECPKCHTENPSESKFCMECATPLSEIEGISISQTRTLQTPSKGLTRGTLFADRYEIIEKLGEGGMGTVYRVEDTKVGEEVAIKIINPLVSSDSKTIERFRNELKFARKIRHKNVCQMFDLGEDEGTHFITMEFVAGEDLKSLLRRTGKLTVEMAARVAKQVTEGLAEAHRLGIVHRDLKPSNIMIDKEGHARIMDFGIARSKEASGITGAGLVIGTPEYMSPEQAEGKKADSRSDIYSLGVILFEVLTGERPFEGESALGVAMKHKGEEPREPRLLNPNIPESINELVLKCLKKNASDRYQNTEELLAELTSLDLKLPDVKTREKQKSGIISKEITVSLSLRKFLVPSLVFILIIAAGLFIWRPWTPKTVSVAPTGKPSLAIVNFRNITGNSEIDWLKKAFPTYLRTDLGQSKYINVLNEVKIQSILKEINLQDSENFVETDLKKIAELGDATHILTGLILKSESAYKVNVTLYRSDTLEECGEVGVDGNFENDFPGMLDRLTPKIKDLFGLTDTQVADDIDMNIGNIRPKSKEAFELFAEGYRAHFVDRNPEKAIPLFEKVLAIEPEFGYGYSLLAQCYFNIGMNQKSREYAEKALEYKGRMTVREMNYVTAYLNIHSEKTLDKAFEAFKEILKDYPDEGDANADLGFFYNAIEEWDETIKYCGNLWRIGYKETRTPYHYLTLAFCAEGEYDKAEECSKYFLENIRWGPEIHADLVVVYLCQGNYDKALLEEKSLKSDPDLNKIYAEGLLKYCREDYKGAELDFEELKNSKGLWLQYCAYVNLHNTLVAQGRFSKARANLRSGISFAERNPASMYVPRLYLCLLYNYIMTGQADEAIDSFDEPWEIAQNAGIISEIYKRQLVYMKGLALLEKGDIVEARKVAVSLKNLVDSGKNRKAMRLYYHLCGLIETHNGNNTDALEYFEDALELSPYPNEFDLEFDYRLDMAPYLNSMAMVYVKMGELDKAVEQCEKIQALTLGRQYYGDIYAKSYYMLGKIFEQKGWVGKAIESYEKFIELWKDADPGIAEVEDARKRLAGLKES